MPKRLTAEEKEISYKIKLEKMKEYSRQLRKRPDHKYSYRNRATDEYKANETQRKLKYYHEVLKPANEKLKYFAVLPCI